MKKVILSEEQIRRMIDKLFVNEQNEVRTESLTVPLGSIWPMGYWKLTSNQISKLNPELSKITNFINNNKGSNITIQIVAGESKVTNVDNEDPSKPKLATGILSQKRGEQMVNYLGKYFKDLLDNGSIDKLPKIPEPQTKIGDTPYSGSNDLKNPKLTSLYQKEQFVSAIISTSKDYECLVGLEITLMYDQSKTKAVHNCDEAIFDLKMNGVSIGVVNLNNGVLDTISSPEFKQVIKKGTDTKSEYENSKKMAYQSWLSDIEKGKIKNPNNQKMAQYIYKIVGDEPVSVIEDNRIVFLNKYISKHAEITGSFEYEPYIEYIEKVNNSINKNSNRYSDNKWGGVRSQTFILDGKTAKSIIDNAPAEEIVLSIKPLVGSEGDYSMFYLYGSHAEVPFVIINNKEGNLYQGEPNVKMARGSMSETALLRTDLCGKPPKNNLPKI